MPGQQLDGTRVIVRLSRARMTPRGGVILSHDVDFRKRDVCLGECGIEMNGFEQQSDRFIVLPLHAIKQRQMIIRPRVARFARDPLELLAHVDLGLVFERGVDQLFAPEVHRSRVASGYNQELCLSGC